MNEPAIEVSDLGKCYRLGTAERHDTLRDMLVHATRGVTRRRDATSREFWALRGVSFTIQRGERVGIIGLNGAGKSTLLKVLSRIVSPTTGLARLSGRLGALLEVGTGFHWELTGRENVFLYGAILGMPKAEVLRKYDQIVDFAGVERFMDTPVKRYSSGMYVRLAFSVAAHLEPDTLLVDEVLSVGDLPFQRKCLEFARTLKEGNGTVLFVSHNMFSIKSMCDRVIYLRKGELLFDGPTEKGISLYESDCRLSELDWAQIPADERPVELAGFDFSSEAGDSRVVFAHGERMRIRITLTSRLRGKPFAVVVAFIRSDQVACCNFSTETDGVVLSSDGDIGIALLTPPIKLVAEMYTARILIWEPGFGRLLGAYIGGVFHVKDDVLDQNFGVFHEPGEWSVDLKGRSPAMGSAVAHEI